MSEESLHEILGDIERSVRDFTGAEAVLAEAEQRRDRTRQAVLEQVKRLRAEVDAAHAPEWIGLLRHLYWQQPGIHGRPLAEAAGLHLNDMLAAIGPAPSEIQCAHCGTELLRTSRSWKPRARYGPPLCPRCFSLEGDARSRTWRVESLRSRIVAQVGGSCAGRCEIPGRPASSSGTWTASSGDGPERCRRRARAGCPGSCGCGSRRR
ncbi:hypothetical protein ABT389_33280 [Streptomyces bacillaris]|uniref:hypothetical protein n=1 Tax=Streptomyces bacillaris TaxID=68179 RepID=UPI003348AE0A